VQAPSQNVRGHFQPPQSRGNLGYKTGKKTRSKHAKFNVDMKKKLMKTPGSNFGGSIFRNVQNRKNPLGNEISNSS